MKPVTTIAKVFQQLATAGDSVENVAAGILRAVKAAKITTEDAFEALARAAYDANGWHATQGKPKAGTDRRAIPPTVRTYVWEVRAALRAGLPVGTYATFYDMRLARRALKSPKLLAAPAPAGGGNGHTAEFPADVAQDLQGVRVKDPETLSGGLFHDLVATFVALPTESRLLLGRQLGRLLRTYSKQVAPLALPAPAVAGSGAGRAKRAAAAAVAASG